MTRKTPDKPPSRPEAASNGAGPVSGAPPAPLDRLAGVSPQWLQVKNWRLFQHYGKRSPPWIKLWSLLLDDRDFDKLSERVQLQLVRIWLLASRVGNKLPNDPSWVQNRAGLATLPDLMGLVRAGWLEPWTGPRPPLLASDASMSRGEERRGEGVAIAAPPQPDLDALRDAHFAKRDQEAAQRATRALSRKLDKP